MAVFSPPSGLDRSVSDVVLSFPWPSSFFAAASFFTAVPFFGAGLVVLSLLAIVFPITDLFEQDKLLLIRAIWVDTPCDTVRATGHRADFVGLSPSLPPFTAVATSLAARVFQTCMSGVIGTFLKAERGHQRAGNAASVTGSRKDFRLQVDTQRGAQTKAPRQPGRSQIASSQIFRRRAWSAGPPGLCWNSRSGSPGASLPLGSRARGRCAGAHSLGSHP